MRVLQYDRYGGPEVLHVAEAEQPLPGPRDVLIRVHVASVGWGDCKLRNGVLQDFYRIELPKIPGRYGCGTIEAIGGDVKNLCVGQGVAFATLHTESGSAAEYVCLDSGRLAAKPDNMTFLEAGSMLQGAVSAYACLVQTADARPGQKVLVHGGAGSVGSACVELAKHLGCRTTAICRTTDEQYVQSLGADQTIAFDQADFSKCVKDQDVVVDLLGGEIYRKSFDVLKAGGKLVYLNAEPVAGDVPPHITVLAAKVANDGQLLSSVCRLAEREVFSAKIGVVVPLADGERAHQLLENRTVHRGRIVLSVSSIDSARKRT